MNEKMTFHVQSKRMDSHSSVSRCKNAEIALDTGLESNPDAFGPADLLLAALSACMIKGIERVIPLLSFSLRSVEIRLDGVRQDVPPRMESIDYEILVDTDESDHRLQLLHENVRKYGTVFNTVAPGTRLRGEIRRMHGDAYVEASEQAIHSR
jgi:uncharacterized OsmC-like protein